MTTITITVADTIPDIIITSVLTGFSVVSTLLLEFCEPKSASFTRNLGVVDILFGVALVVVVDETVVVVSTGHTHAEPVLSHFRVIGLNVCPSGHGQ